MKRFTNKEFKKAYKAKVITLVIGLVLSALALGCLYWGESLVAKTNKEVVHFNEILSKQDKKDYSDKKAYLEVAVVPYKFAGYDDTTDCYYMVRDKDNYLYVLYMSPADFAKLNKEDIEEKPIKVEGVTKQTTKDVKELAVEAYNMGLEDGEKISLADYDNLFGAYHLDLVVTDTAVATVPYVLFLLLIMFGSIVIIIALIEIFSFRRGVSKLDATKIDELDKEMNDEKAFYYKKAKLYLTEHYIINFGGYLRIICYEDVLWMYRFEQRTNGVKTQQALKVLTNDGKTSLIASVDVITKKSKEVLEEIWNTIAEKNSKMLLGYTPENIKAMKQKVKEIKKEGK